MAAADLNFCTHMFMYTKHVPKPYCGFVVILVVVPGSASVRIINFSSVLSQKKRKISKLIENL